MEHPLEKILKACDDHSGKFPNREIHLVLEDGHQTEGVIHWNPPANEEEITNLFQSKGWFLPDDLRQLYLTHNGGVLFQHPYYGGGTEILSLDKILKIHEEIINIPDEWYPIAWTDVVIGSICIDSKRCEQNNYPYLFFLDAMDSPEEAISIHTDFTTWLDRLIVCQGSEYWTWEKYNKFKFK
ncbi:SMI1/KNR4 family protein [Paenibacillus sp. N3/727]|uniref:SMI1/KNR4 family protein n=1 Tax=Paenibacillus sp. N3/727 TaxID=2925845 RepID=UPI001F539026|nr:SMI1/KNR4 family protein [Paenibacillus sp. N3/727]UNK18654.1 SMI1/KNR4 family protein [Paenibacillus sp. N3/727]